MPEISADNVGAVWRKAVVLADQSKRKEIPNLIVNINSISNEAFIGSESLRANLDEVLEAAGACTTSTVASTIFPLSLWKRGSTRDAFYERYLRLWPRISAHGNNRRGTYFQRLIGYPRLGEPTFNQLEHVITAYKAGIRRRSTLQCSILVPSTDLNATPYQGFPCMQQLAFMPEGKRGLRITALYPMHYLWARAYGNYLGLLHLGQFMAREMELELCGMTCFAFIAKLDNARLANEVLRRTNEI